MASDVPTFFLDKCSTIKQCTFKGMKILANSGKFKKEDTCPAKTVVPKTFHLFTLPNIYFSKFPFKFIKRHITTHSGVAFT